MGRVMVGARVTDAQAAALRAYADEVGLPFYQACVRAFELGTAALVGGRGVEPASSEAAPAPDPAPDQMEALREAIERLTVRAELSDRVNQRTLYAAGAAYAAALAGPTEDPERLATIAADADRIFERQLARAREE